MKKSGILNSNISSVIATMGHTDALTICDAGLPIPDGTKRIDLALSRNSPGFLETLNVILMELEVEKVIIASEMATKSPKLYQEILKTFTSDKIISVTHEEFKHLTKESKAIVRTGEFTPYANIILVSGVIF